MMSISRHASYPVTRILVPLKALSFCRAQCAALETNGLNVALWGSVRPAAFQCRLCSCLAVLRVVKVPPAVHLVHQVAICTNHVVLMRRPVTDKFLEHLCDMWGRRTVLIFGQCSIQYELDTRGRDACI